MLSTVAAAAALAMFGAGASAAPAVSSAAPPSDPTIVVHAGGVRNASGSVAPLPNGAVYTATAVGFPPDTATCTTSGGTGTCSISVPPGRAWDVTLTSPPPGYYRSRELDSGSASFVSAAPYTFRTDTLFGTTVDNVPGTNPNTFYHDEHFPSQTFSGLLSASLDDPPPVARCGLNIAIVLDQSNSMAQSGKQATLKAAANEAITALTGTPSTVAIYTFGSAPGPSVARTSTIDAASAQPLHDFINGLPANPSQNATNWDRGLDQVGSGYDEVIFLTDGAPSLSRIGGDGSQTSFSDTEQGTFSANRIKASGTRIVGVGIGLQQTGGADNLRAVTGPVQNRDYFLSSSSDFGEQLKELAAGECSEQLTITKQIQDPSGALIDPAPADANGWTFTNTISAGSTIGSPTTTGTVNGINGVASAAVTIPAGSTPTVTVTETATSGYSFVAAHCSVAGLGVQTTGAGASATFVAAAAEPLVCTFINRRSKATPAVATTPSAGGPVGTVVSDTATVSGGFGPGGTVTFALYPPGDLTCTGTPVFSATNPMIGASAVSGSYRTTAVGTYRWVATYNGDANNNASSSGCQAEPLTTTLAVPTIATTPSAGGPAGTVIFDRAAVSGGFNPTGTVTFRLFPPGDPTCAGTPAFVSTGALSGGGATSGSYTTTAAGTHHWVAIYSGDAGNAIVSSDCQDEPVTTTRASPTIATVPSASGPVGTAVFDTATVSGGANPGGTVTFRLYPSGDATCAGSPIFTSTSPLSGGAAGSASFTTTAAGTYRWVATYSGDADNLPAASSCPDEPIVIGQALAVISTVPSEGGPVGTPLSDAATVSGGFSPTGTVTFALFAPGDAACAGPPVFTSADPLSGGGASSGSFPSATVGDYRWVATYGGDANNASISSGCQDEPVTITQATPAIATTPSAGGPVGTALSDTAAVTGGASPGGTITFELFPPDDTACAGTPAFISTVPLSGGGASSGTYVSAATGTYRWVATYSGDAGNAPASSGCQAEPVTTTRAVPTIATVPSAGGPVGEGIFDTASVSDGSNPTGTVTFALFAPADATCAGTPVFASTNALSGATASSGSFAPAAAGTYRWIATYDGDPDNAPVSSACQDEPVAIGQAQSAVITTMPSAGGPVGTTISDTATVSGGVSPTGTVTFALFPPGDLTCGGPPAFTSTVPLGLRSATSGQFATADVGTYRWIATYSGDANNAGISSGCHAEPVTITQASPTIATAPSAGGSVGTEISDTATVSGGFSPTGTVAFALFPPGDTTCAGTPAFISITALTGGGATSGAFTTASAGTYRWVATYDGDLHNTTVGSGCQEEPVVTTRATPTVTSVPSAGGPVGTDIFDTATVSGGSNPRGAIAFALYGPGDAACAGPPVFVSSNPMRARSVASAPYTTTAVGTYRWVATYTGDADNASVSSGCQDEQVVIGQAQTAVVTTVPSPGGPVGTPIGDTATVSGGFAPTGTVTFALFPPGDATCAGPPVFTSTNALTGGIASSDPFPTAAVGTYRWIATYGGDANNAAAGSGCQVEPVTTTQAAPAIATTPSAGGPVGSGIFDAATVSGGFAPTGMVTFVLFPPADAACAGTPAFVSTNPLSGTVAGSSSFSTDVVGTYRWIAIYDGDANNAPASSGCGDEAVTTTRAAPSIATAPSRAETVGGDIFDTATVGGGFNPTGTVTFALYSPADDACVGPPVFTSTNPLAGGGATSGSFTTAVVGTYRWVASYGGDVNNTGATSGCLDEEVTPTRALTRIETMPSDGGPIGIALTDAATIHGGFDPTGTVTFELFPPEDTLCAGTPVFSSTKPLAGGSASSDPYTTAALGTFRWVAAYDGDVNNRGDRSGCQNEPEIITQATPAIDTIPLGGDLVGAPASDTATVTGGFGPTGTVTFALFAPGDDVCGATPVYTNTAGLSGNTAASGSYTTTAQGDYRWVATYGGDANNTAVAAGCQDEVVTAALATPSIATTPSGGGPIGSSITDTATVSGGVDPTGTVRFDLFAPADPTCAGPPIFTSVRPLIGGAATSDPYATAGAGTYRWIAAYSGDATNAPARPACQDEPVVIARARPVLVTTPSGGGIVGAGISDAAAVTGGFQPTGTVSFALFGPGDGVCARDLVAGDPAFRGVPLSGARASSPVFATTAAGVYQWVAGYGGDANNEPAGARCGDPSEQVGAAAAPPLPPTGAVQPLAVAGGAGLAAVGAMLLVPGRWRRRRGRGERAR